MNVNVRANHGQYKEQILGVSNNAFSVVDDRFRASVQNHMNNIVSLRKRIVKLTGIDGIILLKFNQLLKWLRIDFVTIKQKNQ